VSVETRVEAAASLRERKRERTRHRLEDTCVELARARGIRRTSVRDVCERVLVSEGTFFNYFGDKDGALGSWARRWLGSLISDSSEPAGNRRRPLRGELRAVARRVALAVEADVAFQRDLWGRVRLAGADDREGTLGARFAVAQESGELRADLSATDLARLARASVEATLAGWAQSDAPAATLGPRLLAALDLLLDGARKRNERVRSV